METGSNRESSKAASGGDEEVAAAVEAGEEAAAAAAEEAAVSPPAPAASPRPYYECVFCKRGFTTAQALGGHMNIHRRDRVKPAARDLPIGMTTVSRNVECYNKYRHLVSYPPAPSTPISIGAAAGSSSSSFALYYGSTGAAAGTDAERVSPSSSSPRELSLFEFGAATRDQDLHLGLGRHGRAGDGSRTPERSEHQAGEPERELDLELRLGRRPRH